MDDDYLAFVSALTPSGYVVINKFQNGAKWRQTFGQSRIVRIQPEASVGVLDANTGRTLLRLDAQRVQVLRVGRVANQKCAHLPSKLDVNIKFNQIEIHLNLTKLWLE